VIRRRRKNRFVVDASVVRAAGSSEHPTSSACRSLLFRIRSVCHHVVLTPELKEEWDRHESQVSQQWRASMRSLRKVDDLNPATEDALRDLITSRMGLANERQQMQKDLRLIEAALEADLIVVSLDNRARTAFANLARYSKVLCSVKWINPVDDRERLTAWLEGRATADRDWRLDRQA